MLTGSPYARCGLFSDAPGTVIWVVSTCMGEEEIAGTHGQGVRGWKSEVFRPPLLTPLIASLVFSVRVTCTTTNDWYYKAPHRGRQS